jgi:putative DNA primase/helicase
VSALDAIHELVAAMEMEGVRPIEPIEQRLMSGELIRFRCEGDGRGRQNGWAKIYLDERPAGAFGNYRLGIDRKWKSGADYAPLSREEREKLQREWAEAKEARRKEQERSESEAAVEALEMWQRAQPASSEHPYAVKKRLDPSPLRELDGKLLVPCIAAFSAKNMAAVARLWSAARPDLNFIICADDDDHLENNVGLLAAEAVAQEIGAKVALPRAGRAAA